MQQELELEVHKRFQFWFCSRFVTTVKIECAKLRAPRALVPYVPRFPHALVPHMLSCSTCLVFSWLTCFVPHVLCALHALVAYVLSCFMCLVPYVLSYPACLVPYVHCFSCAIVPHIPCALRTLVPHMPRAPMVLLSPHASCLTCLVPYVSSCFMSLFSLRTFSASYYRYSINFICSINLMFINLLCSWVSCLTVLFFHSLPTFDFSGNLLKLY